MQKNITFFIMFSIICSIWAQPVNCMSKLEELPQEIFEEIVQNLPKKDIKAMRQVSQAWRQKCKYRWNAVRRYITFPDTYGLKQIGPDLFKYTPKKKRTKNNNNDSEPIYVTDINDLPVCPIPGCSNKPEPCYFTMEIGYGFGLLFHLYRANRTSYFHKQHAQLAKLIRLLHKGGLVLGKDSKTAAFILTEINEKDFYNPQILALAHTLAQNKHLTEAQKGRIITHFEDELEFLAKNEKKEGQNHRKEKTEAKQKSRLELQGMLIGKAVRTQAHALASPYPRLLLPPPLPAYPAQELTLQSEVGAADNDYLPEDIWDRKELCDTADDNDDDKKENFINAIMSSLVEDDVPSWPEYTPSIEAAAEPQVEPRLERLDMPTCSIGTAQTMVLLAEAETCSPQPKKRSADFPEDEPANKLRRAS